MKYFVVDVFTDTLFAGNPAGVCLLDSWLPDRALLNIAMENNLSETAFLVKMDGYYDLRWFTPKIEVDLCGHATLAGAFILFNEIKTITDAAVFHTQSGILTVTREGGKMWMDFPARPAVPDKKYDCIKTAFGVDNFSAFKSADLLIVVDSEDIVRNVSPDFYMLKEVKAEADMPNDNFGVILTAPGDGEDGDCVNGCDFVSRFFAPNAGIDEDPVTGRAYCVLAPYWANRLGKAKLTARQLSARGGRVWCEYGGGDRVKIGGQAVLYAKSELYI